jgi:hypothetical protein
LLWRHQFFPVPTRAGLRPADHLSIVMGISRNNRGTAALRCRSRTRNYLQQRSELLKLNVHATSSALEARCSANLGRTRRRDRPRATSQSLTDRAGKRTQHATGVSAHSGARAV